MTTRTYTSAYEHNDATGFSAWVNELVSNLLACGLVQTTDTGQLNLAGIAAVPAVNTAAGYIMFKLPDGSYFFKMEFGTSPLVNIPQIWVTAGAGTDGAGNVTGVKTARTIISSNNSNGGSGTNASINTTIGYTTYICVTNDYFGLVWKANGITLTSATLGSWVNHAAAMAFMKTVDGTGVASNIGFVLLSIPNSNNGGIWSMQCARVNGNARLVTTTQLYSIAVGSLATQILDDGSEQVYTCYGAFPNILPLLHICSIFAAEVPFGQSFPVAMVGPTNHTYAAFTETGGKTGFTSPTGTWGYALLWE